jgi:hypothetical protein
VAAAAFGVVLVALTAWWSISLLDAAKAGKAEAAAGAARLAATDAPGAAAAFGRAAREFSRARGLLGPDWLGAAVGAIPVAGRQYATARDLVAIGLDGSKAGGELAAALDAAAAASSTAEPAGRLTAVLKTGRGHVDAALSGLIDAADRSAALDEQGLLPPLAAAVRSVKEVLGKVAPFLGKARPALALERYLLSSTRRILVVSQDGAELRPTGGFAGSYGIVEVGPQGVRLDSYKDVYVLPDPPGIVAPEPGMRFTKDLTFRDANWWLDYPTSARTMLKLWEDAGQPKVDAIVVVDTVAMGYLLEVLGPVKVPSYSETFTRQNLLMRILYYTQVTGQGRKDRKDVLGALATEIEKRLLGASPDELMKIGSALAKAADEKHVQLYFVDPRAQAAVTALGWSGRMAPAPVGTTDLLAVSNAMIYGSKVNIGVRKTMDYRVALAPDGSAETTLVLGYANAGTPVIPERQEFRDWVRVYRPPGTVFDRVRAGYYTVELGLPVEVRTFILRPGETHTETIVSRVPLAMRAGALPASESTAAPEVSAAEKGAASHYRLFFVKQADLQDIPAAVRIVPPPGMRVTGATARFPTSGKGIPVRTDGTNVRLTAPLAGDLILDVALVPR